MGLNETKCCPAVWSKLCDITKSMKTFNRRKKITSDWWSFHSPAVHSITSSGEKKQVQFYLITNCIFSALKHQKSIIDLISVNGKLEYTRVKMTTPPFVHVLQFKKKVIIQFKRQLGLNDFHITSENPVECNEKERKYYFYLLHTVPVLSAYNLAVILTIIIPCLQYMKLQRKHKIYYGQPYVNRKPKFRDKQLTHVRKVYSMWPNQSSCCRRAFFLIWYNRGTYNLYI